MVGDVQDTVHRGAQIVPVTSAVPGSHDSHLRMSVVEW